MPFSLSNSRTSNFFFFFNIANRFCGEDIPPGTVAYSRGREFIIIIDTNEKAMAGRGLKAKVTFVDEAEGSGDGDEEESEQLLKKFLPFEAL